MKKVINSLLSFVLIATMLFNMVSPVVVLALENVNTGSETDTTQQTKATDLSNVSEKGNIEVETHLVLPIRNREKNNIVFKIYDANKKSARVDLNQIVTASDGYYTTTLELGSQKINVTASKRDKNGRILSGIDNNNNIVYLSINLYSLDKGTYTIELSGDHFVTYSKEVTLEDFSKRISITNERGLFEIGDVNKDGKVNATDSNLIVAAMTTQDSKYDLNLDGSVDIADLNYVTAMISGDKKEAKVKNTTAILKPENISIEVEEKTIESGSLADLFSDDGVVTLKQVDEEPINISLDLSGEKEEETIEMSRIQIGVGENAPQAMTVIAETATGERIEKKVTASSTLGIHMFTDKLAPGTIVVDLGKQVAVKKVTIVITEASENNLADIAKVEFLNNVKVETKQPDDFYTPKNIKVDNSKSEQLTVTFNSVPNVTGYEIEIVGPKINTVFQTTFTSFTIEDLKNYATYKIRVQSANQEWRSGWSEIVEAIPQATRKPPKVDMVKAVPTYAGIDFSWKDMDDTLSYKLYYREKGTSEYTLIDNIKGVSYALRGLKASTNYEAYVIGVNDLGVSSDYTLVAAKTLEAGAAIVPRYYLINSEYDQVNKRTTHIEKIQYSTGTMTNDNGNSIVDDDFTTNWQHKDWQISAHTGFNSGTPVIVLDNTYKMDEFAILVPDSYTAMLKSGGPNSNDIKLHYWETAQEVYGNTGRKEVAGTLLAKTDENKRKYYVLKLEEPINAKAVAFGLTVANNVKDIQIDEVKFYKYDSLVDDVAALFTDDLRLVLADGVDMKKIEALRARADLKDNDEYSPYRDSVLADLDYAEKILKDEKLDDVITLNPNISNSYNGHLKFAMTISDYQPLGIAARAGETLNVYVGSKGNTNIQLVFTQYHAEANAWSQTSQTLQKGLNIIEVPTIGSATEERGGSVYIRYTSTPGAQPIKVRVSGGTKIPMVDTTLLETDSEKKEAIKKYVEELTAYNKTLSNKYSQEGSSFDKASSVLGSTEIVTKYGLFSVSSIAVEDALNSVATTTDEKVNRLFESTEAFNEMMELFYRQKGLSADTDVKTDLMPKARINIRYMQMFDGAFMYAGGYHVGIEYGSIAGLIQAHRNTSSETGYFGWGISHEVGHQINQKDTVFAEVTNNIYALLAQTSNDSDKSRLEVSNIYEKIYDKVTSHTVGRAQNVFVQLGMYWQLHIAYDANKTFDDVDSVFAKVNRISRTYNNTNKYTRDELTILYACMATKKDLTDFFAAWGLKASDKLKEEIAAIEGITKEDKPIYYLNDAARRYRLSGQSGIQNKNILSAQITGVDSATKRVTLTFDVSADKNKILGYEILRNGVSIGFVEGGTTTFTDNVGAENNRAYNYSVVAYDYLLNATNTVTLDEVKISHDGSVLKDTFTITSNVQEKGEITDNENDEIDTEELHVNRLIDGKLNSGFNGTEKIKTAKQPTDGGAFSMTTDNGNAYVIINLNNAMSVSGIKYRALVENGALAANTVTKYKVSVSVDGETWTVARVGTFQLTPENPEEIIYFMGQNTTSETQLWTYDNIGYIKIESDGNKNGFSGDEIDVIAPPGDNIDIQMTDENTPAIGVLEKDYCYLEGGCNPEELDDHNEPVGIIKKGSVIIQGEYRGSPSFNNLLIADAAIEKNAYSGYQLIFAELNDDHSVYEVAKGTWLYVMTQEQYETMLKGSSSIRAYLYRVNDAITLDDQRLTSTSKAVTNLKPYNELSKIELTSTIK